MADDGFAVFYASSYHRLLGQLFAVTGDLAEAENVLQEAYARAFTPRRRHSQAGVPTWEGDAPASLFKLPRGDAIGQPARSPADSIARLLRGREHLS
jgi:predicted RNA polymerase sigma factor